MARPSFACARCCRSEEHTSELQSLRHLVCRLLLDLAAPVVHPLSLHDALPILSEVYRRHCEPLIEERLRGLEAASRLRGRARVAAIIEAFIRPALAQVEVEDGATFIRLRAVL